MGGRKGRDPATNTPHSHCLVIGTGGGLVGVRAGGGAWEKGEVGPSLHLTTLALNFMNEKCNKCSSCNRCIVVHIAQQSQLHAFMSIEVLLTLVFQAQYFS